MSQITIGKHGSESCPIDLTEDDSHVSNKSKKAKKSQRDVWEKIRRRLDHAETKFKESRRKSNMCNRDKNIFKDQDAMSVLLSQCQNLESRVDQLESCLESIAQVFVDNNDTRSDVDSNIDLLHSSEGQQQPHTDFAAVLAHVESTEALSPQAVLEEDCHPSNGRNDWVSSGCGTEFESITNSTGHSIDKIEHQAGVSFNPSSPAHEPYEYQDKEELEVEDVKFESISPIMKLNLWRDDQGRIIMFLYCSVKRLRKNFPQIAAVSGMYLTDDMHNEFGFISERAVKDIKAEAEIRAVYFGIETIKNIFSTSLDDVCVMIVSSCPMLVQAMKSDRAYPKFYSCSCNFRDCEHSANRWATEDSLGKAQIGILPDLLVSMRALKVHWCKLENVSDEEKKVVNHYKSLVDPWFTEYIKLERRKLPNLPENRQVII